MYVAHVKSRASAYFLYCLYEISSVHWDISTKGWIDLKFGTDNHGPHRMIPKYYTLRSTNTLTNILVYDEVF